LAGMSLGHQDHLYPAIEARVLGTEDFVDAAIHRLGEIKGNDRRPAKEEIEFDSELLIGLVAKICGIAEVALCGSGKNAGTVRAKELLVFTGNEMGVSMTTLSEITGLSRSAISRRNDAAKFEMQKGGATSELAAEIKREYEKRMRIAKSRA